MKCPKCKYSRAGISGCDCPMCGTRLGEPLTEREQLIIMMQDIKRKLEAGWLPDSNNVLQPPPTKKEINQWISEHKSQMNEGVEISHRIKQNQTQHDHVTNTRN